jgi:CDP-diacylglycerol---glycerol-3-phosphate 3-phosphatidyltransferase
VNLPNQLTIARLILTVFMVGVMSTSWSCRWSCGALFFILGAITDYLDGYLARKNGLITTFGALMDPLADKILVGAAFVILAYERQIPMWVVPLVLTREFLVTGLRLIAAGQGVVMAADNWGKWKTGAQIALAVYFFVLPAVTEPPFAWFAPFFHITLFQPAWLGRLFLILAIATTAWSGWRYLRMNWPLIHQEK